MRPDQIHQHSEAIAQQIAEAREKLDQTKAKAVIHKRRI